MAVRIPPLTAHIRAMVIMQRGSIIATNMFYYNLPGDTAVNQGNITDVADQIDQKLRTAYLEVLPSSVIFKGVMATLHGTGADYSASSTAAAAAGNLVDVDPLPEHDCVSIQRLTGFKGPQHRGRVYIPFVPETFVIDSTLTASALAEYKNLATAISSSLAAVEANETPVMIASNVNWKIGELDIVTQCRVQPEIKTIKRRRAPKRSFAVSAPVA